MTYELYIDACNIALRENPQWRSGQAHFNVLSMFRPDISEPLRGSTLDPFYQDDLLPAFLAHVANEWSANEEEDHAVA